MDVLEARETCRFLFFSLVCGENARRVSRNQFSSSFAFWSKAFNDSSGKKIRYMGSNSFLYILQTGKQKKADTVIIPLSHYLGFYIYR